MIHQSHPPAFILSKTVEALGHTLTTAQAIVLDVAQALNKGFMKQKAVSTKDVIRIVAMYHSQGRPETRQALSELAELGILIAEGTEPGQRLTIRLAFKLRGPEEKQSSGIGSLVIAPEPPPTVRELCESGEFRQSLCERYLKPEAVCSFNAAMVLAEIVNRAGIDQADLTKLLAFFIDGLLTPEDFCSACEELQSLGAIEILKSRFSEIKVRLKRLVESATSPSVRDVLAVA